MYAEVNELFGDIVKVTPFPAKVVGDMTLFLMAKEMQPRTFLKLDENATSPSLIPVELFSGVLGVPLGAGQRAAENYPARPMLLWWPPKRKPGTSEIRGRAKLAREKTPVTLRRDDLLS